MEREKKKPYGMKGKNRGSREEGEGDASGGETHLTSRRIRVKVLRANVTKMTEKGNLSDKKKSSQEEMPREKKSERPEKS